MKVYGGVQVHLYSFLILTLDGGDWSASYVGHLTLGEGVCGTYMIGGCRVLRISLDASKTNLDPTKNRTTISRLSSS